MKANKFFILGTSSHRGAGHEMAPQPVVSPKRSRSSSPSVNNGDAKGRRRMPRSSPLSSMRWSPTCCPFS